MDRARWPYNPGKQVEYFRRNHLPPRSARGGRYQTYEVLTFTWVGGPSPSIRFCCACENWRERRSGQNIHDWSKHVPSCFAILLPRGRPGFGVPHRNVACCELPVQTNSSIDAPKKTYILCGICFTLHVAFARVSSYMGHCLLMSTSMHILQNNDGSQGLPALPHETRETKRDQTRPNTPPVHV